MKPYVKPELFFESYELSQNVASCRWDMMNQTERDVCTAQYDPVGDNSFHEPNMVLFTDANMKCNVLEEELKDLGYDYCYFSATSKNANLFNS